MSNKVQSNRDRVARYRNTHRRIDYVPSKEVLTAIEKHKAIDNCLAGVIDQLILAGSIAITGNGK